MIYLGPSVPIDDVINAGEAIKPHGFYTVITGQPSGYSLSDYTRLGVPMRRLAVWIVAFSLMGAAAAAPEGHTWQGRLTGADRTARGRGP